MVRQNSIGIEHEIFHFFTKEMLRTITHDNIEADIKSEMELLK